MEEGRGKRPRVKEMTHTIRISGYEKEVWTAAAEKTGRTLSEFMRYAATRYAEEITRK